MLKLKKDFIDTIDRVYLIKITDDLYSICQHRYNRQNQMCKKN